MFDSDSNVINDFSYYTVWKSDSKKMLIRKCLIFERGFFSMFIILKFKRIFNCFTYNSTCLFTFSRYVLVNKPKEKFTKPVPSPLEEQLLVERFPKLGAKIVQNVPDLSPRTKKSYNLEYSPFVQYQRVVWY